VMGLQDRHHLRVEWERRGSNLEKGLWEDIAVQRDQGPLLRKPESRRTEY
jgi:hypothetical protein